MYNMLSGWRKMVVGVVVCGGLRYELMMSYIINRILARRYFRCSKEGYNVILSQLKMSSTKSTEFT